MTHPRPVTRRLLVAVLAAALPCLGTRAAAQPAASAPISREAFASLRWLQGRWVGSGGGFAAFFEEYAVLNDSTIEQREFPDSTFTRPSGTSTIEWRGGTVLKRRGDRVQSALVRVSGDTARFESVAAGRGGFTWIRLSATRWRAILDGRGAPTVYVLERFGGVR